ncbi:MAG: Os1348 family NHLP clan protein [Vicinamibacterales bacterium]
MAHRSIEMLIGRLITDEQFRATFVAGPEATLLSLRELGLDLSPTEIAALVSTDPVVWARAADALDPRLQKATLTRESRTS